MRQFSIRLFYWKVCFVLLFFKNCMSTHRLHLPNNLRYSYWFFVYWSSLSLWFQTILHKFFFIVWSKNATKRKQLNVVPKMRFMLSNWKLHIQFITVLIKWNHLWKFENSKSNRNNCKMHKPHEIQDSHMSIQPRCVFCILFYILKHLLRFEKCVFLFVVVAVVIVDVFIFIFFIFRSI